MPGELSFYLVCNLMLNYESSHSLMPNFSVSSEPLKRNHAALKIQQESHVKKVKESLDEVETKTKRLLLSAEKIAPKEEWHERLQQADLPVDLAGLDAALKESSIAVKSIESKRIGWQRKEDIDALSAAVNDLFKDKEEEEKDEGEHDESRKRKMSEDDDADDAAEDDVAGEEASNQNNDGNGKAKKKKRQSAISNFFVGKSTAK